MSFLFSNRKNIRKCSHQVITEKLLLIGRAYFYCYKCGKLIIVKNLKIYESITEGKLEYNPIKVINQMLLYDQKKIIIDNFYISDIYIKNRDIFIYYIKQFSRKVNYSKSIFYSCLHLMDYYLIHELKNEITKRTIALIALGFFLISAKFYETDIYEPKLNQFCKVDKDIVISMNEMIINEIKCLKMMDYNIVNYSVYDWLKALNKVGYVFNNKINKLKFEQIKERQKLLLRRIIHSNILYSYDSFKIAISIIHISMDNIFFNDKISKELFDLFLTIFSKKFSDYEQCYIDIKAYIFNDYKINNEDNEKNTINLKVIDKTQSTKLIYLLNSVMNKNRYKSKNNKLICMINKNIKSVEYQKKSNMEKYISKLNTINKKSNLSSTSKDLLSSFSSIYNNNNNNNRLTIDCSNNNIDNINLGSKQNIRITGNYINSKCNDNTISKETIIDNGHKVNNFLKKSKTYLSNSPYINKEENKISNEQKTNYMMKNKNFRINKFVSALQKENNNDYKNFMNMKGKLKLIYKKNQIKDYILKKDGFINWKGEKKNFLRNNDSNDNTITNMKKSKTNFILPKFNIIGKKDGENV